MQFNDISIKADHEDSLKEGASDVVSRLRPEWGARNGFQFKIFSDGITNKLIGVYVEGKKKEMILIRVYGHNSELMIDRKSEIRNMKLLHANDCGSELYASFKNGLAYQFLPGSMLTMESVIDPSIFPLVAKACAKMHSIEIPGIAVTAIKPCIWKILRKFHSLSPDGFPDSLEKDSRYREKIPFTKPQLLDEIDKMEHLLGEHRIKSTKIVFAHNDLLLGNIVTCKAPSEQVPTVNFIDYEYGDYNYREYDIANHFNEFVGMGDENGNLDYENFYPSKDFQILWINEYIKQFNYCKGNNDDPAKQKVDELQTLVDKFRPLPNLMWGIWALIQSKYSAIDFDFLNYAVQRLGEYKRNLKLNNYYTIQP